MEDNPDGRHLMDYLLSRHADKVLLGRDRQCTATSRTTGERCGRYAALGQFVCDIHGGKTPAGLQAAKERMLMLLEPATEVLFRATRNAPPCEYCGRSDADRDPTAVRAAAIILKHNFGSRVTMEVIAPPSPLDDAPVDELISRLEHMLALARRLRDGRTAPLDGYIDGALLDGATELPTVAAIEPPPDGTTLAQEGSSPWAGERSPHGDRPSTDAPAGFAPLPAGLNPDGGATVLDDVTRALERARRELAEAEREMARVSAEERHDR